MVELRCFTCEGSFDADIKDLANPDADDFQALADAQSAHIASHPDDLKVGMPPPLPARRDWAGSAMAARGERVPPRQVRGRTS